MRLLHILVAHCVRGVQGLEIPVQQACERGSALRATGIDKCKPRTLVCAALSCVLRIVEMLTCAFAARRPFTMLWSARNRTLQTKKGVVAFRLCAC